MPEAKRPSIAFLIGSLRQGGAEGQLVHLMHGLREHGWNVHLMLLHYEGERLPELLAEGFDVFPVKLPKFRPRWNPLPWMLLPLRMWRTWRHLRNIRPDLLHATLFWAHVWGWLAVLPFPAVRLVTSRLQTWSDTGNSRLLLLAEQAVLLRTDLVISNSRVAHEGARRREGRSLLRRTKRAVVNNGLDLQAFDREPPVDLRSEFPQLADARIIAVTVANLLPYKGYDLLLETWDLVVRSHPGAKILCVGADSGILESLRAETHERRIAGNVVFAGLRQDVPSLLRGADMAVHASRDEGFSNAILEYMAAGLPIVTTDVGGNREALADGHCGLVVPPRDAAALAEGACKLIQSGRLRAQLGRLARRRVEQRYTMQKMVERHIACYTAIKNSP